MHSFLVGSGGRGPSGWGRGAAQSLAPESMGLFIATGSGGGETHSRALLTSLSISHLLLPLGLGGVVSLPPLPFPKKLKPSSMLADLCLVIENALVLELRGEGQLVGVGGICTCLRGEWGEFSPSLKQQRSAPLLSILILSLEGFDMRGINFLRPDSFLGPTINIVTYALGYHNA